MVFVCVFQNSLQIISLMFVGHLDELLLAGASLATSFVNVTGFNVLVCYLTYAILFHYFILQLQIPKIIIYIYIYMHASCMSWGCSLCFFKTIANQYQNNDQRVKIRPFLLKNIILKIINILNVVIFLIKIYILIIFFLAYTGKFPARVRGLISSSWAGPYNYSLVYKTLILILIIGSQLWDYKTDIPGRCKTYIMLIITSNLKYFCEQ